MTGVYRGEIGKHYKIKFIETEKETAMSGTKELTNVDQPRRYGGSSKCDVHNAFTFHPPKEDQPERYAKLRERSRSLAYCIEELCPPSRERSLALTNLQNACMWANAAIACNE